MKSIRVVVISAFCFFFFNASFSASHPTSGFFLPDSVHEMTVKYKTVKSLIVLPVMINDSVAVNLVLDTGCRNLILFGRRFKNVFTMSSRKPVQFSGLGRGRPVTGKLSIGNRVSIGEVLGEKIPIVIVEKHDLFDDYHNVHGVIGYDIFLKFEIEINQKTRTITFRPALRSFAPADFTTVSLDIVDSRPMIASQLMMNRALCNFDLMIDTGSSLGLLLKTTNIEEFDYHRKEKVLGFGLNGPLSGFETISRKLTIEGLEMKGVPTGIVSSPWHDNASIGMNVLKNYIVILNYCKAYASFKLNV